MKKVTLLINKVSIAPLHRRLYWTKSNEIHSYETNGKVINAEK